MPRKEVLSQKKRASLAKARLQRSLMTPFNRSVQGFAPAKEDQGMAPLHTFVDVHPGSHHPACHVHPRQPSAQQDGVGSCPSSDASVVQPSTASASSQTDPQPESQELVVTRALVQNLATVLFAGYAPNTSERRLLVGKITQGLHEGLCAKLLGVSPKMIQRGRRDVAARPEVLLGSPQPKQKRQRMDINRHKLAMALLDILAPVQSGHPWRVVRTTEDHLYKQYLTLVQAFPGQQPISKSYFIKCVLDKKHNRVHHENSPDFCPLCSRREELFYKTNKTTSELQELNDLNEHVRKKNVQWRVYHSTMAQLVHNPGMRLIVQDFNKQETNTTEMQVLTIVVYEASSGALERHYFHYFLPPGVTNDCLP
jgi:hypothetical protein